MSNDYLAPVVAKLTYNGAANLVGTLEHPIARRPTAINGGRIYTGLGKWTHIAAMGVKSHLVSLNLAEVREEPWLDITPLGREVAEYLQANWKDLSGSFRDGCKRCGPKIL